MASSSADTKKAGAFVCGKIFQTGLIFAGNDQDPRKVLGLA
jgi:hypothetical protein